MELTLSPKDVIIYNWNNRKFISMYAISSIDYIAFRCCYFNNLHEQAYVLACQAIEKQLKAHLLYLKSDENLRKYNNHKLIPLIHRIEFLSDKYDFSRFIEVSEKLWLCYEMFRYPDNKVEDQIKQFSYGGADYNIIDEMFIFLSENFPIPKEVKYKIEFYNMLCNTKKHSVFQVQKYWALINNNSLNPILSELIKEFDEVYFHFNKFKK